jgi:hypothetical protein
MTFEEFKIKFVLWIQEEIEPVRNDGFPVCPYAKRARLTDKIQFINASVLVNDNLNMFDSNRYDIGICWLGENINIANCKEIIEEYNKKDTNLLYFISSPDSGFFTQNFTNCIFIQSKSDILEKRKYLHTTDYYKSWPQYYYETIVNGI